LQIAVDYVLRKSPPDINEIEKGIQNWFINYLIEEGY
jgi:hypothetical protein